MYPTIFSFPTPSWWRHWSRRPRPRWRAPTSCCKSTPSTRSWKTGRGSRTSSSTLRSWATSRPTRSTRSPTRGRTTRTKSRTTNSPAFGSKELSYTLSKFTITPNTSQATKSCKSLARSWVRILLGQIKLTSTHLAKKSFMGLTLSKLYP